MSPPPEGTTLERGEAESRPGVPRSPSTVLDHHHNVIMSSPTVSVVLPTYNRADVLPEAIDSVLAQDFDDWELLVVDDGSEDDTAGVVGPYLEDGRIAYLKKEHVGSADSRNLGVRRSRGRYVTFLDSDDVAAPNWLSELLAVLRSGSSVVCCSVRHVTRRRDQILHPEDMGPAFQGLVMKFTNGGSYMLARELFDAVGGFDVRSPAEHTELGIRLAEYCAQRGIEVRNVYCPLITVRQTRDDHMRNDDESVFQGARHFIEKHRDKLSLDRRLHHDYVSVLLYRGRGMPLRDVAPYYLTILRLRPFYWRSYASVARNFVWSLLSRASSSA